MGLRTDMSPSLTDAGRLPARSTRSHDLAMDKRPSGLRFNRAGDQAVDPATDLRGG